MNLDEINEQANSLLGKAAELFSQPFNIPTASGVSNAPAKAQLSRAKETRDQTSNVIDAETMRNERATTAQKEALEKGGSAVAALAIANQDKAQKDADSYELVNKIFGIGQDNASEIAAAATHIKDLDATIEQQKPIVDAKREVVRNMQSVGPGDDFLTWFGNQFQLSSKIADYNIEAQKLNTMDAQRDELQHHMQEGVKTASMISEQRNKGLPTITMAQAKATADGAVAKAAELSAHADIALAKTNVDFATKKLAEDLAIVTATIHTTQIDLENSKLKYESQITAIKLADTHAQRMLQAGKLLEELGEKKGLKTVLDNYDNIVGKPAGTTNVFMFNKLPSHERENIVATAMGNGGNGPLEAAINIGPKLGPLASDPTKKLFAWIGEKAASIAATSQDVKMITDPKLKMQQIDNHLKQAIDQEKEQAYKPGTLFHELPPSTMMMGDKPIIANDSDLGKALAPLATQTGGAPSTEAIARTIGNTFTNPADAGRALSQYYAANVDAINKVSNLSIAKIAPVKSYFVPPPTTSFFTPKKYDLTNQAQATQYFQALKVYDLTKAEQQSRRSAEMGGTF